MILRVQKLKFLALPALAVFCLLAIAPDIGAAALPESAPETITNLAQLATLDAANLPARRLLPVRLRGTVQIGGSRSCAVIFDGSPTPYWLPKEVMTAPLRRGARIQFAGDGIVAGTNLFFERQPLIDLDGLHVMFEQAAGVWLAAGKQPLRVRYFDRGGDFGLSLAIEGPGLPREPIPDAMLFHAQTNPADGTIRWRNGLAFKGYEGDWLALPDFAALPAFTNGVADNFDIGVSGRTNDFGLQFDGFIEIPRAGFYTIFCASDDGSQVDLGGANASIRPLGRVELPPLPRLAACQLIGGEEDSFCAALEGLVTFAANESDGLRLELSSGKGRAMVGLRAPIGTDPQWLVGARVHLAGICQSVFTPEGYRMAGKLTADSEENLRVLELPRRLWDSQPVLRVADVRESFSTNRQPHLARVQGTLETNALSGAVKIQDETGAILLADENAGQLDAGVRVEALGLADGAGNEPRLCGFALRQISSVGGESRGLPLLTTIEEVKQMSREEAKRGYPVKVRGIVTFVWPDAGFFLQDATWSIDVRMAAAAAKPMPRIGDFWEVAGETFAEFAPNILATRATLLGPGVMPQPLHPNWTELVDGSLDTQYIEVPGVVLSVEGKAVNLLTRGGHVKVQLPEMDGAALAGFQGASVRVRGCLIPGRNVSTQQVKLGEFELRNASVTMDEPAPQNPFALPLKHAADLLLFDAHASPIQRVKISGIVLLQRDHAAFVMDGSNGVRVAMETVVSLHPGDRIEVVGFPDLTGAAPVFNNALVRRVGLGALPASARLDADHLVDGQNDATLVTLEGTLISQRVSGADQILEMRSGTRLWLARLPVRAGRLPDLALGSALDLTGVYAGQGGDRARGRDIDSFELLLNSPQGVWVVRSPSWWTVRHAFVVAGALLAVLLLAAIWIGALHRQVEERTSALKSEIEDHKRTELELEKKTLMLTKEIEERLRIEAEVERGHKQLLVTSRLAGMAEVATSVLHNVGNVMTSVNVLSASIVDLVRHSKISSVARLGELLGKNRHDLGRFVAADERGRKMPDYVSQLGAHLAEEQALLLQKVKVLNENIHHINEIVALQQNYAKVSGVLETLPPEEVVEAALQMHGESLKRHGIKLVRDYAPIPAITVDRHKMLQILFNLFENAKYACLQGGAPDKKIVIRLQRTPADFVRLTVADNGMGIPAENLTRIFGQGFSTRRDGHGFGLHSSILAAQDMGGTLTAHSDGPDKGAVFTLEIPMKRRGQTPPPQN